MGVYIKCQYKILENKKSPFDCDIFSTVNNCGHNTDNGEILFIFLNEVLLFILHRDPAKFIFGEDRICAVGGRSVGRSWKYMAVPVFGGKVRRRNLSSDLYSAGTHIWIYDDCC